LVLFSVFVIFFFFSSRRRHTRFSRDWSSDVALPILTGTQPPMRRNPPYAPPAKRQLGRTLVGVGLAAGVLAMAVWLGVALATVRSEERRVGKECRCRWGTGEEKKKGEDRSSRRQSRG